MAFWDWLTSLFGRRSSSGDGGLRIHGEPTGGVSSFHLWWEGLGDTPLTEVGATLTVMRQPDADRLYFWALQVTLGDASRSYGGAHTGLQWNPRHPASRAVNWGGYSDVGNVSSVLSGSPSTLPSTPNDPNTRDYPWQQGVPYRFRVYRVDQGWRAEVTDTSANTATVIRDLLAPGDRLTSPVVWSEVFASCDDPPAAVRWSDLYAKDGAGNVVSPTGLRLNFPPHTAGDCENTEVQVNADGVYQLTGTTRTRTTGELVSLHS